MFFFQQKLVINQTGHPDIKDINHKQDFRNGTFVTFKRKYFSKPLQSERAVGPIRLLALLSLWSQIVCFALTLNISVTQSLLLHDSYLSIWSRSSPASQQPLVTLVFLQMKINLLVLAAARVDCVPCVMPSVMDYMSRVRAWKHRMETGKSSLNYSLEYSSFRWKFHLFAVFIWWFGLCT